MLRTEIMRALLSVSDKTGIIELAKGLNASGIEIVSTGGTEQLIRTAGIPVIPVSEVTGFPECLDGRVKTLHPNLHGAVLARRESLEHMKTLETLGIVPVDILVVNLYPFKETVLNPESDHADIVENIDIGGPAVIRAAAKNYQDVLVVTSPDDYAEVLDYLREKDTDSGLNLRLAAKAWNHIAHYDALIADYFRSICPEEEMPQELTLTYEKVQPMRYGENPHQRAAYYRRVEKPDGFLNEAVQLHGKELSFNNINDLSGAYELCCEFDRPAVVACKHANPCGVGVADDIRAAYELAYTADPTSIFGGIVVANRTIDAETASRMHEIFLEIIMAPDFSDEALEILQAKKNIRILRHPRFAAGDGESFDWKRVNGGLLLQEYDNVLWDVESLTCPTVRQATEEELDEALFAWTVVKGLKSNAVAITKNGQTLGLGIGQVNRIWATQQAVEHAVEALGRDILNGACLASDAFFPFDDCVRFAAKYGIQTIVQPGGSVRDADSIKACDEAGIAMIMTGMRHFRH